MPGCAASAGPWPQAVTRGPRATHLEDTVRFIKWDEIDPVEPVPGVRIRAPYGENLMISLLEMAENAVVPLHEHPHEQGGIVLEGSLDLTIGEETRRVTVGEAYLIPPEVPHRAVAVGGHATCLDIFTPIREDYKELANRYIPESDTADR